MIGRQALIKREREEECGGCPSTWRWRLLPCGYFYAWSINYTCGGLACSIISWWWKLDRDALEEGEGEWVVEFYSGERETILASSLVDEMRFVKNGWWELRRNVMVIMDSFYGKFLFFFFFLEFYCVMDIFERIVGILNCLKNWKVHCFSF